MRNYNELPSDLINSMSELMSVHGDKVVLEAYADAIRSKMENLSDFNDPRAPYQRQLDRLIDRIELIALQEWDEYDEYNSANAVI